jgi:hypothetical protein
VSEKERDDILRGTKVLVDNRDALTGDAAA